MAFFVFTEERDGAATLLLPPFSFGERKLGKEKVIRQGWIFCIYGRVVRGYGTLSAGTHKISHNQGGHSLYDRNHSGNQTGIVPTFDFSCNSIAVNIHSLLFLSN